MIRLVKQLLRPQLAAAVFVTVLAVMPVYFLFSNVLGGWLGARDFFDVAKLFIVIACGLALLVKQPRKFWSTGLVGLCIAYAALFTVWSLLSLTIGNASTEAVLFSMASSLRIVIVLLVGLFAARYLPYVSARKWLLAPAVVVAGIGLLQVSVLPSDTLEAFGYEPVNGNYIQFVDDNPEYVRAQSTLRGPNPFGVYLILVLVASSVYAIRSDRRWWGLSALAAIALFFTYSRSAYIGALLALAVLGALLLDARWRKWLVYTFGFLAIAGAGSVWLLRDNDFVQNVIFHTDENSLSAQSSNDARLEALQDGLSDAFSEPFGRGPGTAGPASFRNNEPARIAENYYIQLVQEVGWLGLGLFVAINIAVLRLLWVSREKSLQIILLASFAGITFTNLLSHAWTDDTIAYLWWGLAGLAVGPQLHAIVDAHGNRKKRQNSSNQKTARAA